jgi:excisionase family DNA binding protein
MKKPTKLTISVTEAGERLGVSRNLAYQAARSGEIPTVRIGHRLLVPIAAFERLLASGGVKADR